jgi:hypothetical protein
MDVNAFILRRTKDLLKKKKIDKELTNVFKHHFGIKSNPNLFLAQWQKMYEKYQAMTQNTRRFYGQPETHVLQQLAHTLNADENRPYFFLFEDVDIQKHQVRIEKYGYIHISTEQSKFVEHNGWITGDLAVDIGGTKPNQMHDAFDLLNCVGMTFKYTTNFTPLPKVNHAFFEPKLSEHSLKVTTTCKIPDSSYIVVSLPKAA